MATKDCPYTPGTFRSPWAFGRHFMLCKPCRRFAPIAMAEHGERSIRSRLVCTRCGQAASLVDEDGLRAVMESQ